MKTIKTLVTVVIILCSLLSKAQYQFTPLQRLEYDNRALKDSGYIFEGIITQQKYYYSTSHERVLCSIVQITKIFRGSPRLKLGSIKLLTTDTRREHDAGPEISMGRHIIFGMSSDHYRKPADSTTFQSLGTDNILIIDGVDYINFAGTGAEWGWRRPTQFKIIDSLYSFLKANGLEVQQVAGQTGGVK